MKSVFEKVCTVFPKYLTLKNYFNGKLTLFEWVVSVFLVFEYASTAATLTALRNIEKHTREIIADIEETENEYEEDNEW